MERLQCVSCLFSCPGQDPEGGTLKHKMTLASEKLFFVTTSDPRLIDVLEWPELQTEETKVYTTRSWVH